MVMVPALWVSYALVLHFLTPLSTKAVVLLFLMCPFFSYVGVMAVEAGMIDMKDLRPAFLRLLPSFQGQATLLPRMRSSLQKEVRRIVKKYGPDLGSLYYGNMNEWTKDLKKSS
jgi:glycerol-3-phosphate O-acyltransferase/dihydroxyacetone phosphate acyltransferase